MPGFADRTEAGLLLAPLVVALERERPLVLALPRGGVPVAYEVARALDAPLDVWVARKLGAPGRPELAIGAIAEGGGAVVDERAVSLLGVTPGHLEAIKASERRELARRVRRYRGDRPPPVLRDCDVILVDDGLATGATAEAALRSLRAAQPGPRTLTLAVPVAPIDTAARLRQLADAVVVVREVLDLYAVGLWYSDFSQTTDEEVARLLASSPGR